MCYRTIIQQKQQEDRSSSQTTSSNTQSVGSSSDIPQQPHEGFSVALKLFDLQRRCRVQTTSSKKKDHDCSMLIGDDYLAAAAAVTRSGGRDNVTNDDLYEELDDDPLFDYDCKQYSKKDKKGRKRGRKNHKKSKGSIAKFPSCDESTDTVVVNTRRASSRRLINNGNATILPSKLKRSLSSSSSVRNQQQSLSVTMSENIVSTLDHFGGESNSGLL